MGSFKLVKKNKSKVDMKESDAGNSVSGSVISITDPDLAQQALNLEKRKQQLTKQYTDQINQIDTQLAQIKEQQIKANEQSMQHAQRQASESNPNETKTEE